MFFRDIRNLDILSTEDLDFVKAKTKKAAQSSYKTYNNNVPQTLHEKCLKTEIFLVRVFFWSRKNSVFGHISRSENLSNDEFIVIATGFEPTTI